MALILASSGGTQYLSQILLGNLKILYTTALLFPWSHSFLLPKLRGHLQGKAGVTQTLGALQQCHIPLIAPHTIFRFAFQTGEISVGWDIPLQKQVEKT